MSVPWSYVLKFVLVGDAAVGKTSLLVRLTDQRFLQNPDPTLGVEFGSKLIQLEDMNETVDLCEEGSASAKKREVTAEEAQQFAKDNDMVDYIEASAKTGQNVDEAFTRASRSILEKIKAGLFDDKKVAVLLQYPIT
ncbi:hypothetical protein FRC00_002901 [Tulasnella sp. 408]|nr:hypothetical protein FRC00_002901 [Tulasnella sp. 408]